jgi:hypothetical protein
MIIMKRYVIYVVLLCVNGISLFAQKMPVDDSKKAKTNVKVTVGEPIMDNNEFKVTYSIKGLKFNQSFSAVSLWVSKDRGETYKGPLKEVSGDVGPGIRNGDYTITWSAMKEMPFINEELIFDVRGKMAEEKIGRSKFISYVGNGMTYIGFRAGMIGKTGFYGEIRLSPLAFASTDYTYKNESIPDYDQEGYYEFTDGKGYSAFSVLGGLIFQTGRHFHVYTGAGYGWQKYMYEITNYSYSNDSPTSTSNVVDDDHHVKGLELDAGMIYMFKRVLLSAGLTTINFKTFNYTGGIGLTF